jgi:carbon monoxide dehydrogenase subunit G
MKTSIEKTFHVEKPIEEVWQFLSDPTKVVTCLSGATIKEKTDENNYTGEISMKFGPVSAKYDGKITIENLDPEKREMIIAGRGTDSRGKGGADMKMMGKLKETKPGQTEVFYKMDISITGMLAQFGSRLIADVSNQVTKQFIQTFKAKLENEEPGSAEQSKDQSFNAGSIVGAVVKEKLGNIFGKKKEEGQD